MEKRKLLLAEGNEELALALEEGLRGLYTLRLCRDGQTALELVHAFKPDILVLDLMLPGLDGISLLQDITEARLEPMVLATSRYYNEYILDALGRFGVGYLMVKPCDVRATIARIGDLTSRIRPAESRPTRPDRLTRISNFLRELRFRPKLKGYIYLRDAVLLMADNPDLSITKELYPEIADRYGTPPKSVEKCIRSALEGAWERRDHSVWQILFPPGLDAVQERPSNADMIARLADWIRCGDTGAERES